VRVLASAVRVEAVVARGGVSRGVGYCSKMIMVAVLSVSNVSWAQRGVENRNLRAMLVNISNAMIVVLVMVMVMVMVIVMVALNTMDAADRGGTRARGGAMRAGWTLAKSTAL